MAENYDKVETYENNDSTWRGKHIQHDISVKASKFTFTIRDIALELSASAKLRIVGGGFIESSLAVSISGYAALVAEACEGLKLKQSIGESDNRGSATEVMINATTVEGVNITDVANEVTSGLSAVDATLKQADAIANRSVVSGRAILMNAALRNTVAQEKNTVGVKKRQLGARAVRLNAIETSVNNSFERVNTSAEHLVASMSRLGSFLKEGSKSKQLLANMDVTTSPDTTS